MPTTPEQRQRQFEEILRLLQARRRPRPLPVPEPEPEPEGHPYIAAGIRGLSGLLATLPSATGLPPLMALGGGIAGAGELAAELAEGSQPSLKRMGVEAALGAVPLGKLFRAGKLGESILRGGAYAGAGELGRELAREEEPDPLNVLGSMTIGGGVSGLLGKLLGLGRTAPAPSRIGPAPTPPSVLPGVVKPVAPPQYDPIREGIRKLGLQAGIPEELPLTSPLATGKGARRWVQAATAEPRGEEAVSRLRERAMAADVREQARRAGAAEISSEALPLEQPPLAKSLGMKPQSPVEEVLEKIKGEVSGLEDLSNLLGRTAPKAVTPAVGGLTTQQAMQEEVSKLPLGDPVRASIERYLARASSSAKPATEVAEDIPAIARALGLPAETTVPLAAVREPRNIMDMVGKRGFYGALQGLLKSGRLPEIAQEEPRIAGKWLAHMGQARGLPRGGAVPPLSQPLGPQAVAAPSIPEAAPALATALPEAMTAEKAQAIISRMGRRPGAPAIGAEERSLLKGERGGMAPALAARLGLGAAGALAGGVADPLGDPTLSALLGGAAGVAAPSVIRRLAAISPQAAAAVPKEAHPVLEALQTPEGAKNLGKQLVETLPAALRFNLLTSPNLLNNVFLGPYAAGMMKGLELTMMGDPRGPAAIKRLVNPALLRQKAGESWREAQTLTGEFERVGGELMGEAPNVMRATLASPGSAMTWGDVMIRKVLMEVGLTEQEARLATMTGKPGRILSTMKDVVTFGNRPGGKFMLPFARTLANIVEGSVERAPGIGFLVPQQGGLREQLVKQGMGLGVMGAGYGAGQLEPENPMLQRMLRSAAGNVGGPAGLLSAAGFAAAKARQAGQTGRAAVRAGGRQALEGIPLPSADIPLSLLNYLTAEPGTKPVPPAGLMPSMLRQLLYPPGRRRRTRVPRSRQRG